VDDDVERGDAVALLPSSPLSAALCSSEKEISTQAIPPPLYSHSQLLASILDGDHFCHCTDLALMQREERKYTSLHMRECVVQSLSCVPLFATP